MMLLCELTILVALAYWGTVYLIYEIDPTEIILNCAALALIEELDTMVFGACLPLGCQMLAERIAVPSPGNGKKTKFVRAILLILASAGAIYLFWIEQVQMADQIDRAMYAICGGNLDFVYAMDPGGAVVAAKTIPHTNVHERYQVQAVKELVETELAISSNVEGSLSDGAVGSHYGQLSVDLRTQMSVGSRMSGLNPNCVDFSGTGELVWPPSFVQKLIEDEFGGTVDSCGTAADFCSADNRLGLLLRQWCPATCGCDMPNSSQIMLFANGGCPPTCWNSAPYTDMLADTECVDQLPSSPPFQNYIDGLRQLSASYSLHSEDWSEKFEGWIAVLEEGGCNNTQLTPAVFGSLCAGNAFNLKPLLHVCPISCGCPTVPGNGFPALCPAKCVR
jgi:hypothetical protein